MFTRLIHSARYMGFATLLFTLCGCADDPTEPVALEPCTGAVTVSVTSGSTPRISWAPACTMVSLLVEEGASDRWQIIANTDVGFGPGVRYGTVPAGTTQNAAASPLAAGVLHDVILFRGPLASPSISAVKEFTP